MAAVVFAGLAFSAASLALEATAPVSTSSVTLATPTVGVTVPTVTVQTPTVPITTPTVPIQTPTVPTVTATAPAPLPVPTVSATTPTVSASASSVTVSSGKVSVGTSSGSSTTTSAARAGAGSGSGSTGVAGTTNASSASSNGSGASSSAASGAGAVSPGSRARAHIASRERALKAIVARFHGCLAALPDAQREVVELRTGMGASRPLSPRATAARMHLGVARVTQLERQALLELRSAAATHSCARVASFVAAVVSYFATTFGGGPAGTGGVEAARYDLSPAAALGELPDAPRDEGLLGKDFSPIPGGAVALLALVLIGVLALSAIVADATGRGPRHAQWRHRVRSRLSSWR
jgi:sigma-70-like protein